jgi:hypothetical protein
MFWAGCGLQHCRELLVAQISEAEACSALVPVTPEALMRQVLDLEAERAVASGSATPAAIWRRVQAANPWRVAV